MTAPAMAWAMSNLSDRCDSGNELAVLMAVAYFADRNGRGCFASQQSIADKARVSRATAKRCIDRLAAAKVLVPGDPSLVEHLRPDRRPEVWDLPMPKSARAGGHGDPSSSSRMSAGVQGDPSLEPGGHGDPSTDLHGGSDEPSTGGQMSAERGVTVTPKQEDPEHEEEPPPPAPPAVPEQRHNPEEEAGNRRFDQEAVSLLQSLNPPQSDLDPGRRRKLVGLISAAMAGGWSTDALVKELTRDRDNVRSPIGLWMHRLQPDRLGPPRSFSRGWDSASASSWGDNPGSNWGDNWNTNPGGNWSGASGERRDALGHVAWCGACEWAGRMVTCSDGDLVPCPDCNPAGRARGRMLTAPVF